MDNKHISSTEKWPLDCVFVYIGCLNIHETHVTANNSVNNYAVFFFVSDLKIVYYNRY